MRHGQKLAVVFAVAALGTGCAARARINRPDGSFYRGRIVSSTDATLRVQLADGRRIDLGQSEVTTIRHPGRPFIAVGSVFTGVGGFSVFFSSSLLITSGGEDFGGLLIITLAGGAALLAGPGLGFLSYGLATRRRSEARARRFERVHLVPRLAFGEHDVRAGLVLCF